jgi:hypothetical protein
MAIPMIRFKEKINQILTQAGRQKKYKFVDEEPSTKQKR